jgi:hypothetical protein
LAANRQLKKDLEKQKKFLMGDVEKWWRKGYKSVNY